MFFRGIVAIVVTHGANLIGLASVLRFCCRRFALYSVLKRSDCFPLDVDECEIDLAHCGENAYCTNTIGSFLCTCKPGFAGSDNECTGEYIQQSIRLLYCLSCYGYCCYFWFLLH